MPSQEHRNRFDLRYLRLYALAAGVVSILVGFLVLFGWILDLSLLKSVLPGRSTMKPLTALGFVLCGVALVLVNVANARRGVFNDSRKRVVLVCSGLMAGIGVATLSEYLFAVI